MTHAVMQLRPEYENVFLLHESATEQLFVIGLKDPQHEMPHPILVNTDNLAVTSVCLSCPRVPPTSDGFYDSQKPC